MNQLSNSGSIVLCDDILGLIFSHLPIKELFRFKRVSQQFRDCTQEALRRTQSLAFGFNVKLKECDYKDRLIKSITGSIDVKASDITRGYIGKDYKDNERMLKKLPRVQRLYIRFSKSRFTGMKAIVKHLPLLREIYFFEFSFYVTEKKRYTSRQWAQLMANVTHITIANIEQRFAPFLADIIRQLKSLRSLEIYEIPIESDLLVDYLPPNIRSLKTMRHTFDTPSIASLTTKCHQIQELSLSSHVEKGSDISEDNEFGEWLLIICNRLKNLKTLTIPLGQISAEVFAENIAKLSNLRHLAIVSHSSDPMLFNTTSMTPLTTIRSLSLYGIECSPEMWSQLAEVVPNMRHLSLDAINCHVNCSVDPEEDCFKKCFKRFMNSVATHPRLKALTLGSEMDRYDDNVLTALRLFKKLDQICIHIAIEKCHKVYEFITETLANRHRVFRLGLLDDTRDQLLSKMNEMAVHIPKYVKINGCGTSSQHKCNSF